MPVVQHLVKSVNPKMSLSSGKPTSNANPSPMDNEYTNMQPISSILETCQLPVNLLYDASQSSKKYRVCPEFNQLEPIRVYSNQQVHRINATHVQFSKDNSEHIERNHEATIPVNYHGWFAVFGHPSTHKHEPIVPHFRRIGQLAISTCKKFIVSGDRPLRAFLIEQLASKRINFHPAQIHPGMVFNKGSIYMARMNTKSKKLFRKKEKAPETMYLSVKDNDGITLFIPCETEGLFFTIESVSARSSNVPILKAEEIIERYELPVLVKLIQALIPTPPHPAFNGLFVLSSTETTSTAIASSTNQSNEQWFEIASKSSLRFSVSPSKDSINETNLHKERINYYRSRLEFASSTLPKNATIQSSPQPNQKDNQTLNSESLTTKEKFSDINLLGMDRCTFFPTTPSAPKHTSASKSSSVVTLDMKRIRRSYTFVRPKYKSFDVIPSNQSTSTISTNMDTASDENSNSSSSLTPSSKRHLSDSGSSSCSSSYQPSLLDDTMSEFGELDELLLPPPPPELLSGNDMYEHQDALPDVPNEESSYYGLWHCKSPDIKNSIENPFDQPLYETPLNGIGVDSDSSSKDTLKVGLHKTASIDENGYVIASDLRDIKRRLRHMIPESIVEDTTKSKDIPNDNIQDLYVKGENEEDDNNFIGTQYSSNRYTSGSYISRGSHVYISLYDTPYSDISTSVKDAVIDTNANTPSQEKPIYANDCDAISRRNLYTENSNPQISEDHYDRISKYQPITEDGYLLPVPSPHNGPMKSSVLDELTSVIGKGQLRTTATEGSETPKKPTKPLEDETNTNRPCYVNLSKAKKQIPPATDKRNTFIQRLSSHKVKKEIIDAIDKLNDDDLFALMSSSEPIETLKELLPQISKSDVFKVGLCLKNIS